VPLKHLWQRCEGEIFGAVCDIKTGNLREIRPKAVGGPVGLRWRLESGEAVLHEKGLAPIYEKRTCGMDQSVENPLNNVDTSNLKEN
jgi:hypothetical protein